MSSVSPVPGRPAGTALPVALILGSCVSLQFGAALAARLFPVLGSWGVTALRLGLACVVLMLLARPAVHRWHRSQWKAVLLFGLAMAAMNGSFYSAIARIPLGTAVAIEFLGPLALSAVLSRRRADLLCVALALTGVGLFGLESSLGLTALDPIGVVWALIAGVFWAAYVLASAKVGREVRGQGGLAVAVGIGSLALLPLGAHGVIDAVHSPRLLLLALGTALLASVIPYSLELAALRRLPRHVFSILLSLEPAIAMIAGLALLAQPITALGLVAVVLVVAASIGTTLTERSTARRDREDRSPRGASGPGGGAGEDGPLREGEPGPPPGPRRPTPRHERDRDAAERPAAASWRTDEIEIVPSEFFPTAGPDVDPPRADAGAGAERSRGEHR